MLKFIEYCFFNKKSINKNIKILGKIKNKVELI